MNAGGGGDKTSALHDFEIIKIKKGKSKPNINTKNYKFLRE
jgi:hypothetical protein